MCGAQSLILVEHVPIAFCFRALTLKFGLARESLSLHTLPYFCNPSLPNINIFLVDYRCPPMSELSVCRHNHRDKILTLGMAFSPKICAQSSPHDPVSSVCCSAIWTESTNSCPTFSLSSIRQSRKDLPQTRNCLHQSLPTIFFNSPCRRIYNHSVTSQSTE